MTNPYKVEGPALISFSGGRTSAYMLRMIIDAHGGTLPDDVLVAFANTGKEREQTLQFVHDCDQNWNVPIHWLEWKDSDQGFEEVGFIDASRNGEPFAALMAKKQWVPSAPQRFCTQELKVNTLKRFALSMGWSQWRNIIGLRYDEGRRVWRAIENNDKGEDPWVNVMPLAKAKVTRRDIDSFWRRQPFDLQIRGYESNCDLCFLKNRQVLKALIRENPGMADWWIEQENLHTRKMIDGGSYSKLVLEVATQPLLPFTGDAEEYDAECGLHCGT